MSAYIKEEKLKAAYFLDKMPEGCQYCEITCQVRKDEMTRRPHDCPLTEICPECLSDELEYQRFAPEGPEVVCDNCGWPDTGSAEVSNDHPEILIGILVFSLVLVAGMILGFILRWWLG